MTNDGMPNDENEGRAMECDGRGEPDAGRPLRHSFVIRHWSFVILACLFVFAGCAADSKLTSSNYDQITLGMSKSQVETILGPPTSAETQDMLIFKKTTYRYEEGKKFALITFKNDEVDSKDSNLGQVP